MFYLLLDILIYNFTPYLSYFFFFIINNKSYIYNLSIALFLDALVLHMPFLNIIWLTLLFLLKKYLFKFNYHNFLIFFIFNLSTIFLYYLINNFLFNIISIGNMINVLIINSIMIALSYKFNVTNIK